MSLEVVTEGTYLGDVIGDINRRRGSISDQDQKGVSAFVQGFVPLCETFGYINFLRSATSGRSTFTMIFDHYEKVPAGMIEKLRFRYRIDLLVSAKVKKPGSNPRAFL